MTNDNAAIEIIKIAMYPDGRMDVQNAGIYLKLEPKTLAIFRSQGKGPKFIKRGRIFYYKDDLDLWLNADGRLASTTQAQQRQEVNDKKQG